MPDVTGVAAQPPPSVNLSTKKITEKRAMPTASAPLAKKLFKDDSPSKGDNK